ncbi:MAG: PfkB family carbohydrate kinase [Geminicoccaceae bacterium]
MARVLTLGIAVLDTVLGLARLPSGGGKHYARARAEVVGGIAANAAIAIVRLGGEALLASRFGDDLVGERLQAELAATGVDTSRVEWLGSVASSISTILVDDKGERLLVNHSDPALFHGPASPFDDLVVDAVMTDTLWPDGAIPALQRARALAVPGVLDFDRVPRRMTGELLAAASHVVFGQQGLEAFAGTTSIETGLRSAARQTDAWLACTAGGDGVYWLDGAALRHLPAFPIEAVDTLGAGDVFHGAFALALGEGRGIEASLRFASAAAALKCTGFGGGAASPGRAQVERFLVEQSDLPVVEPR